jgi:hypothetical protein
VCKEYSLNKILLWENVIHVVPLMAFRYLQLHSQQQHNTKSACWNFRYYIENRKEMEERNWVSIGSLVGQIETSALISSHATTEWTNRRREQDIRICLPPAFMLVSCSAYSLTLKMEATHSSETSVEFQRTTRHYVPEDRTLHNTTVRTSNPTISILFLGFVINEVVDMRSVPCGSTIDLDQR